MQHEKLYAAHGKGSGWGDWGWGDGYGGNCISSGDGWGGGWGNGWGGHGDGWSSGDGGNYSDGDGVSKSCPHWEWALAVAKENEA